MKKNSIEQYRELEETHNQLLNIADLMSLQNSLEELLSSLLQNFRDSVHAEAGSMFLVERPFSGAPLEQSEIVFHISQNDRVPLPELKKIRLPINETSISGYVATTKEILNISDVYEIGQKSYSFNKAVDEKLNYRSKSVLVTPMTNKKGDVIGVLMLINCMKKGKVVSFPKDFERLVKFQSVYAGMVIENAETYQELEKERNSLEEKVKERTKELADAYGELKEKDTIIRNDLEIARDMQTDIMPKGEILDSIKKDYSIQIKAHYTPCDELGGDFWDIAKIDKDTFGLLLMDFEGHGVSAALNTFQLKSLFHQICTNTVDSSVLISQLNECLVRDFANYATGIYLTYNRVNSILTVCRAGHPYPFYYKAKTGEVVQLEKGGIFLGVFASAEAEDYRIKMETGDKLFLFTDGLYEVIDFSQEEIGYEQLEKAIIKFAHLDNEDIYRKVEEELRGFAGDSPFLDDVILLIFEKT